MAETDATDIIAKAFELQMQSTSGGAEPTQDIIDFCQANGIEIIPGMIGPDDWAKIIELILTVVDGEVEED